MLSTYVGYVFPNNRLIRSRYLITEEHSNRNDYIQDFTSLKLLLIKKYGSPEEDRIYWKRDSYKDMPDHWGFAISTGDLLYYSVWQTEDTEISMTLDGDNYEIFLLIDYTGKEFKDQELQTKEAEALDDL